MASSILHHCVYCGAEFRRSRPDANAEKHCSVACRFWGKIDRSGGPDVCWNWVAKSRSKSGRGYGVFRNSDGRNEQAHRVAWKLTNGPIPDGLLGCHKCDNVLCCNPAHLFLGTPKQNTDDMLAKGRHCVSPEGRERTRQAKIGKPRPPEVRAKLSAANMGKAPANKGKKMPKMSEAKRLWWAAKKAALQAH